MKVHHGKGHKYLGMTLDFSAKGKVKVSMYNYVEDIIAWDGYDGANGGMKIASSKRSKKSTVPEDLFKVDEDMAIAKIVMAVAFHNIATKKLYMSKCACPDLSVATKFLTTWVCELKVNDLWKLAHMIEYVRGMKDLSPLVLGGWSNGALHEIWTGRT